MSEAKNSGGKLNIPIVHLTGHDNWTVWLETFLSAVRNRETKDGNISHGFDKYRDFDTYEAKEEPRYPADHPVNANLSAQEKLDKDKLTKIYTGFQDYNIRKMAQSELNEKAADMIRQWIHPNLRGIYTKYKKGYTILEELKKIYGGEGSNTMYANRAAAIRKEKQYFTQWEYEEFTYYRARATNLFNELEAINESMTEEEQIDFLVEKLISDNPDSFWAKLRVTLLTQAKFKSVVDLTIEVEARFGRYISSNSNEEKKYAKAREIRGKFPMSKTDKYAEETKTKTNNEHANENKANYTRGNSNKHSRGGYQNVGNRDLSNVKCFKCNKYGHLARNCKEDDNTQKIKCYRCGKYGHKAADCEEEEEHYSRKTPTRDNNNNDRGGRNGSTSSRPQQRNNPQKGTGYRANNTETDSNSMEDENQNNNPLNNYDDGNYKKNKSTDDNSSASECITKIILAKLLHTDERSADENIPKLDYTNEEKPTRNNKHVTEYISHYNDNEIKENEYYPNTNQPKVYHISFNINHKTYTSKGNKGKSILKRGKIFALADGGANVHIHGDKKDFVTYAQTNDIVAMADTGASMEAVGVGNIIRQTSKGDTIVLRNVLHCPTATQTLISEGRLRKEGFYFTDDPKDGPCIRRVDGRISSKLKLIDNDCLKILTLYPMTTKGNQYQINHTIKNQTEYQRLHNIFHCSDERLQTLIKDKNKYNIKCSTKLKYKRPHCPSCEMTKSIKHKGRTDPKREKLKPLERLHGDLMFGPKGHTTQGNSCSSITIDACTSFAWVALHRLKSDYRQHLEKLLPQIQRALPAYITERFRSDNGELKSVDWITFCKSRNIIPEFTSDYDSEANSIAERTIRTIVNIALSLLLRCNLPKWCWGFAILQAGKINNVLPKRRLNNISPYEQLFKQTPDLSVFHPFGCLVYVHTPLETRPEKDKHFDARSFPYVYAGNYSDHMANVLNLHTAELKQVSTKCCNFIDDIFPALDDCDTDGRVSLNHIAALESETYLLGKKNINPIIRYSSMK